MATPTYQGAGQQTADNGGGLFGRLGSFLGGSAVAYAPAPTATKPESSSPSTGDAVSCESESQVMTCSIDPEALASGHIAIVIPRERLGP